MTIELIILMINAIAIFINTCSYSNYIEIFYRDEIIKGTKARYANAIIFVIELILAYYMSFGIPFFSKVVRIISKVIALAIYIVLTLHHKKICNVFLRKEIAKSFMYVYTTYSKKPSENASELRCFCDKMEKSYSTKKKPNELMSIYCDMLIWLNDNKDKLSEPDKI